MINNSRIHLYVILVLVLFYAGCPKTPPPPIVLVVLEPPFTQTLEVKNNSQNTITVLPASGSQSVPVEIMPNGSEEIQFTFVCKGELDQSGDPIESSKTATVHGEITYVAMVDNEGVIEVETTQNQEWTYIISFGDCCFSDNFDNIKLEIINVENEKPPFGIPELTLCE